MFDPAAEKLWYFKACTTSTSAGIALLIQDNVKNIRETVFIGTLTGTLKDSGGGTIHNYVMQSYSVGYSEDLEYWDNPASPTTSSTFGTSGSGSMGVIIPTLRDQTCLKSADESASITQTDVSNGNTIFFNDGLPDDDDMNSSDDYGKDFLNDLVSTQVLGIYDLKVSSLFKNTWCTAYTTPSAIS